jgi:hypothetical protein
MSALPPTTPQAFGVGDVGPRILERGQRALNLLVRLPDRRGRRLTPNRRGTRRLRRCQGRRRGQLTADGRAALVADADQSGAVDEAVAQAAARAEKAEADYKAARAGLAPRSNTVVDSLRHNQWWSRTVRELDAAPAEKLVGTSQRLIETADGPELGWAATELGSYLRSRNVPDDWLDATLHQVSPTLKAAAEQRRTATQAAQIVTANGRSAKKAMRDAGHGSYKRPQLVNPSPKYDPDAQAELVAAQRGPTTLDSYRP